ncbi:hypothetical protein RSSM_02548 [Rhodopirellula sallentina SM41]|uniref:Uncharacterized protein n=1 Tax=Rhodopirellula sallentina SM41 TaxID=1263870 RepID=M5UDS7_9BACT|nr:hypothetical protein RSSM_02548 [Rhodopirellula sallentina SM41]
MDILTEQSDDEHCNPGPGVQHDRGAIALQFGHWPHIARREEAVA